MGDEQKRREVVELQIRAIMPNRFQPRTKPSDEGLQELASSIRQHGVLEPIIVRPIPLTWYEGTGRQYELIAGERRWRACSLAEIATIPALILESTTNDQMMLELAITENLQREDLHPLDEALAFGRMQSELDYSYAQIAERLGKSKGYVQNRLRLLSLDEELQQLVRDRPDTLGHVYELARVSDQVARTELITAVRDDSLTRAETRTRVQALLGKSEQPTIPSTQPEAAQDASYFQKYDQEEKKEPTDSVPAVSSSDESYFQKYDQPEEGQAVAEAEQETSRSHFQKYSHAEQPRHEIGSALFTPQEWSTLHALVTKMDQVLQHGHTLQEEEWPLLERLASRLHELLEMKNER
jgi:ParB family chromosome partitioning protein